MAAGAKSFLDRLNPLEHRPTAGRARVKPGHGPDNLANLHILGHVGREEFKDRTLLRAEKIVFVAR